MGKTIQELTRDVVRLKAKRERLDLAEEQAPPKAKRAAKAKALFAMSEEKRALEALGRAQVERELGIEYGRCTQDQLGQLLAASLTMGGRRGLAS